MPQGEGRDRARAVAQGRRARDELRALGEEGAEALAEVERWLLGHREGG